MQADLYGGAVDHRQLRKRCAVVSRRNFGRGRGSIRVHGRGRVRTVSLSPQSSEGS